MSTVLEARTQLSRDIGDYFTSTTTGIATDTEEIVDTLLSEEIDKTFVTERTWIWMTGAQVGGPTPDEERRVTFPDGLVSSTLSVDRAFTATIQASVVYYISRQFSALVKDDAITQALTLALPHVWKRVTQDVTIVADQFDYSLSASKFYHQWPHQVHRVSTADTEVTWPLYDWGMLGDNLHLGSRLPTGDVIRAIGITAPALSDLDAVELLIVSSRAAMSLYETGLSSAPNESQTFYTNALARHTAQYADRILLHSKMVEMGKTIRMHGHEVGTSDFNPLRA